MLSKVHPAKIARNISKEEFSNVLTSIRSVKMWSHLDRERQPGPYALGILAVHEIPNSDSLLGPS